MQSPQLILDLSAGPLPSTAIQAVNLDTWHIDGRCPAIAVWHKDAPLHPLYFQHGSEDAALIAVWADAQLSEQFLRLPSYLFAADAVRIAFDEGEDAVVILHGDGQLPFTAYNDPVAAQAIRAWNGEATMQHVAAIA